VSGTSAGASGAAGYRPSEAQLAAVAARHGLGRLDAWRPLAGGLVNPVLLLNERVVLRVNVRERDAPKVAKEAWVLGHVARAAGPRGPRVPAVLAADTGRAVLPYDYLLLEFLPGRPGADVWPECDGPAPPLADLRRRGPRRARRG
jgi:hypothetical protein